MNGDVGVDDGDGGGQHQREGGRFWEVMDMIGI
jgi:hypothetical protein